VLPLSGHVFISYSHLDGDYVTRLKVRLGGAGMTVWTDEGIDKGADWARILEKQIETCAVLVPVMSENSRLASWVAREIDFAQELGKPIAPLLLGGRRFLSLRNLQDENVSDGQLPSIGWIQWLRQLTGLPPSAEYSQQKPVVFTDGPDAGPLYQPSGQVVVWESEGDNFAVPEGLGDCTAIAAGITHNLALHTDGHVTSWGRSEAWAEVPDYVREVTAIAVGMRHCLALHADGHVSGWGIDPADARVPEDLASATAIAAGGVYNVALHRDGQVTVWGAKMEPVTGFRDVAAISTGISHVLALHDDGHITAWGSGDYGQATVPEGLRDIKQISAGSWYNLVLHNDGQVSSWGGDLYGEATIPAELRGVRAISAGNGHSLALLRGGHVVAWGGNGRATVPAGLRDVTRIAAGSTYNLAIVSERFI
jgi:TIR domain/Regulator of chromosome condensation (RCC1) repeat